MLDRREFLRTPALAAAAPMRTAAPVSAEVRPWNGKPTLFVNSQPIYACFYALTDCPGGRWSWEEIPQQSIRQFAQIGFRLYQLDLFLESVWPAEGPLDIEPAQKQIRGVLDACPDGAVVLRWHLNAPPWWAAEHPEELTRYANGDLESIDRNTPPRTLMDDLRRTPRVSLASKRWREMATAKTIELLERLAKTPEGNALAGIHVACGVYGEWHYWGFMRNEPDTSATMQARFGEYRKALGKSAVPVPGLEERAALDDGIFRDPQKRDKVIDYYRCQQELVADNILHFCRVVKQTWPRKILTGTFYGYFFSMFDRQATGGHLCLPKILASPDVDYLSAPQAYGSAYRDMGGCGITRALVESVRLHGKLFLDEMDQTPSWKWANNVDTAFVIDDLAADSALIRRNTLESFVRGMGLWFYDFGPANMSGWWADRRLLAEIRRLKEILERYHRREYRPAGDVLLVYDTEVFYYTGSVQGTDNLTDTVAVNRVIGDAWRAGAAIETIHLADLERVDLGRFKVVVLANTWLLTAAQRRLIRERVMSEDRHVVFQGAPGYCDGTRLSVEFVREVTGLPVVRHQAAFKPEGLKPFSPHFTLENTAPGLVRRVNVWFATVPPLGPGAWRDLFRAAGAHIYVDRDAVVHTGAGLLLVHSKDGGRSTITLRNGRALNVELPPKSSWLFDSETGERLL
jgi:hypothetical protein